jgi:hypothetical protein
MGIEQRLESETGNPQHLPGVLAEARERVGRDEPGGHPGPPDGFSDPQRFRDEFGRGASALAARKLVFKASALTGPEEQPGTLASLIEHREENLSASAS